MRAFLIKYGLLILICSANCQKPAEPAPATDKAAQEAERIALILESPDRQSWQMPEKVIEELRLKNGDTPISVRVRVISPAVSLRKLPRKGTRLASM